MKKNFDKEKKLEELYSIMGSHELLNENLYAFDKPIQYKTLKIYPIDMSFYVPFQILANCLQLKKNSSGDVKAISKSYLDYLFYLCYEKSNSQYVFLLEELLLLCLQLDRHKKDEKENYIIDETQQDGLRHTIDFASRNGSEWHICIENEEFDGNDFDNIKKIICEQNKIEITDDTIHPDLQEKIEEYEEYLRKKSKEKICSLEGQVNILMCITGLTKRQLETMSIRTFFNVIERYGILLDYSLGTLLSPNIEKKDRDKILSWIGQPQKLSKLEKITTDFNQFESKFNGDILQKNKI